MTDTPQHLSVAEVEALLKYLEKVDAIVVGGQSLTLWCRIFLDRAPEIARRYSLTSEDLDVYGPPEAAHLFAENLRDAEIYVPDPWDNSPNAAVVVGSVGKTRVRIDFMRGVLGVDDKSLKNKYVTLRKMSETTGEEIVLQLLHPLDCLRSRLSNINDLHRHDLHSIRSGEAALMLIDVFIDDLLRKGFFRQAQAILVSLFYIGRDRCIGKAADLEHNLNPIHILQKYRVDRRLDSRWRSLQLAKNANRLLAIRGRFQKK